MLPSDDALPEALDPNPCKSPEAVATLPGVAIGKTLAKQLDVGLGGCVQLTSPTIGLTYGASGARPSIAKQFRVIAILEAGFDQYDSKFAFTDLYEAQAFYGEGDNVMGVEMKVNDIENAHAIARDVNRLLNNNLYRTMDWHELNRSLFTALLFQQIAMSCVLALIIVVAAFTVIATLIMVVLEKKKGSPCSRRSARGTGASCAYSSIRGPSSVPSGQPSGSSLGSSAARRSRRTSSPSTRRFISSRNCR